MAHGYGLSGSGSNLWTREVARALSREGHTVHLLCQESRPERLDFVAEAWSYDARSRPTLLLRRDVPHPGRCVVHRPDLEVLPTYVRPQVPSDYVFAILDLEPAQIEEYLRRNAAVAVRMVREFGVPAFHVNHVLLLSEALRRMKEATGTPYAVMPHGSALEYVVKKDEGMRQMAGRALQEADRLLVLNEDVRRRLDEVFPELARMEERARTVRAGVDTDLFRVVPRTGRAEAFARVEESLAGVETGRRPEDLRAFLDAVDAMDPSSGTFTADFRAAAGKAADHRRGTPDSDAATRLASVAWGEEPVIVHVGRFVGGKGVPSVITAMPGILARHPRTRLVMVGAGPLREPMEALVHALGTGQAELVRRVIDEGDALDPDGYGAFEASRRHLEALEAGGELETWLGHARSMDLERVVFTGYLDHDALCRILPLADAAVFPSLVAEASPLVVAEAAASGCLPMGTDFAGMGRTLATIGDGVEEELGSLMMVRQEADVLVEDITRNVVKLLDMDEARRDEGARALRKAAVERFDWRRIAETLVDALIELDPEPPVVPVS